MISIDIEVEIEVDKTGLTPTPKGFLGNNTLRLNGATIIQAVQEYLDRNMIAAPRVTSVTQDKACSSTVFDVMTTDEVPKV